MSARAALVTGGSRGIGRAIALRLAAEGRDVAITYAQRREDADSVVAEIDGLGRRAIAIRADLRQPDDARAVVPRAIDCLGHLDLLVANAGVASRGVSLGETETREIEQLLNIAVLSTHILVKDALPALRAAGRSDVIVISSTATDHIAPNGAPYSVAKAALECFALGLAEEEAVHGIRVNIVAPGLVRTDMGGRLLRALTSGVESEQIDSAFPFGGLVEPADVAGVVHFLTSDDARYITGQRIAVHGGVGDVPGLLGQLA